jgi:uncharacterized protein
MDIFDFRLRPPTGGLLNSTFYSQGKASWYAERHRFSVTPAAQQQSMELLEQEMKQAHIVGGVMPARVNNDIYRGATNEEIAEIELRYPGVFYGFGTLDLSNIRSVGAVAREVEYAISELGLHGISLDPGFCLPPLKADDHLVVETAVACGRLGVPLLLTMAGLAGPDTYWCHPQYVDRLAAACPETNIVLAHGCWPHVQAVCAVALARPNVYVSPDQGMMNTVGTSDYVAAINTFMADQFVFASSFPTGPLVEMVEIYEQLDIRDDVRPKIMYENAVRLLGLN